MTHTKDTIKDLLNQCHFKLALSAIDSIYKSSDLDTKFSLNLFKSQIFFEMHQVKEAYQILATLASQTTIDSESYLYVNGRIAYLDQNYDKAEECFRKLADKSECVTDYYRALIGLANVFYTLKRYSELQWVMPELEELCDVVPFDSILSFKLLKANVTCTAEGAVTAAEDLLFEVITEAVRRHWNYFVIKALYSLAKIAQGQKKGELLAAHLRVLRCYLNPEEAVLLTYLVNEQFKEDDYSVEAVIRFDAEHKRVGLRGDWIGLHDKPLLYNFMEKLHLEGGFVTKQSLAEYLWPDQEYLAKSHDPRIFDIARRVRGLIEKYEDQPVCLLSGRYGYKLAAKNIQSEDKSKQPKDAQAPLEKKALQRLKAGTSPISEPEIQ